MNTDHSTMEMKPEMAKKLFEEGAVLIIAGVPVGTEIGIDLCTYQVGDRFRGIKMIPPGAHLIYCSTQGSYGDSAPRVGFIHYFKPYEILVREWDPNREELRERKTENPDLEKQRIRENLKDLDRFLAPFDYRFLVNWKNLTNKITEAGVIQCSPKCGVIRSNIEYQSCPDSDRPRGNQSYSQNLRLSAAKLTLDENDLLPDLKPVPGSIPNFINVPLRVPSGSTPEQITMHYMDSFIAVDELMKHDNLTEEIQLAFICFLAGCSLESLTHWRKLLNILCNSEISVGKYKIFYMDYTETLSHQLPMIPEELMEQNPKNTVCNDVKNLLINCTLNGLSVSADKLSKSLKQNLKWDFSNFLDENPEDMPIIVES